MTAAGAATRGKARGCRDLPATADGHIVHAELEIEGQVVMLGDPDAHLYAEPHSLGRTTAGLHILVDDNAALVRRAVAAGAELLQPPTDMSYGASSASVRPAVRLD